MRIPTHCGYTMASSDTPHVERVRTKDGELLDKIVQWFQCHRCKQLVCGIVGDVEPQEPPSVQPEKAAGLDPKDRGSGV